MVCAWAICTTLSAQAQFISGTVVEEPTETPLANVLVALLNVTGQRVESVLTDSAGAFRMRAPLPGDYVLQAERIGMQTVSATLAVRVSERVEVTLRMSTLAVPIDPLTIDARSEVNIGSLAGYYARAERVQRTGIGRVITRDRIEERPVGAVTDIFREIPGVTIASARFGSRDVRFTGGRTGCSPQVYLDGVLANRDGPAALDELVPPSALEGIEIYRGLTTMGQYYDTSGCGIILLWTRRGVDDGRPFALDRLLAFGAIIGLILLIVR